MIKGFAGIIVGSDLSFEDKLTILEYAAFDLYVQNRNLEYLEYKLAIKELKDGKL